MHTNKTLCVLALTALTCWAAADSGHPVELIYPAGWPKPAYHFDKNPLTREGIELGRRLFYDPILSRDSTVSCANCHLSFTAFTHVDHARSHGIQDRIGRRNSLALINLAWSTAFMWDGSVNHLDVQALAPISHPAEMDHSIQQVVKKLNRSDSYRKLFQTAFGDTPVTGEHTLKALAQFELTLVSAGSKYDRVTEGLDTFTQQEQNGYRLFKINCASCHREPLFTNGGFEKNGLPADTALMDFGRMTVTGLSKDSMTFKVPTLRNIEFSYPYMHDGRFKKLREVLKHYDQTTTLDIALSPNEMVDLTAFLRTLTDRTFLFNPDFGFPR